MSHHPGVVFPPVIKLNSKDTQTAGATMLTLVTVNWWPCSSFTSMYFNKRGKEENNHIYIYDCLIYSLCKATILIYPIDHSLFTQLETSLKRAQWTCSVFTITVNVQIDKTSIQHTKSKLLIIKWQCEIALLLIYDIYLCFWYFERNTLGVPVHVCSHWT